MQTQGTTSGQFIQRINIIFYIQLTFIIAFNAIAFVGKNDSSDPALSNIMLYVLTGMCAILVPASLFIYKMLVARAGSDTTLGNKLTKYMTATIIRMACLELPGFFAAGVILMTGNLMALLGAILVVTLLVFNRPSIVQLLQDIPFTPEEKDKLNNPNAVVM